MVKHSPFSGLASPSQRLPCLMIIAAVFALTLLSVRVGLADLQPSDSQLLPATDSHAQAFAALAQGQFEAAAAAFAALANDDEALRYWQAMAQLGQGQCQQPEALLRAEQERGGQLEPSLMDALARIWASCGSADESALQQARNWAEALYQAQPNLDSAATLAMVMAALGQFDDAQDFQGQALFEALRDGQLNERPDLVDDMERYRQGQPAEQPYAPSHPVFRRAGL